MATARTYFLLFIFVTMTTLATDALRCHRCRRVRGSESTCNRGRVNCGRNNVCKSDVRVDSLGRRVYTKFCTRRTGCRDLNQVFCNSRKTRCFKCCNNRNFCNANTRDVRAALNDDCRPNPCRNGGRCTDGVNSYTCACATGFTGTNCETNIDDCNPDPCVNGVCEDGVDSYTCTCETGWRGTNCDLPVGTRGRWYNGECGESKYPDAGSKPLPSPSIVGGDRAQRNEFPWQISFSVRTGGYYEHFCGGAIINRQWVVTAAHCNVYSDSTRAVSSGKHNLYVTEGPETITRVSRVESHPSFISASEGDDIALIRLESPLSFNQNVQPICPPEENKNYVNSKVVVSGWGTLELEGWSPSILRYTTLNVTTNAYCQSRIDALSYDSLTVDAQMICASDNRGSNERDTCEGDSGGPMAFKTADSTFQLVGVTSWGLGCASGAPGVYARVTEYLDWIDSVIPEDERN